jgi:hypothetical protein
MRLPDCLRLPFSFEPDLLRRDLDRLSGADWTAHFVRQNYEGDWSVIPLRGPAGATHPVMMIYPDPACQHFEDTPFLRECPYFTHVLSQFDCPLQSARLMRLAPGSRIKEHTDHDLSFEDGMVRIHIPVVTSKDVIFVLNGRRLNLQTGEAWYLRLSDPHSVSNCGVADRVHLVIDAVVDDWTKRLFGEAEGAASALAT